jgi:hypothetical protein
MQPLTGNFFTGHLSPSRFGVGAAKSIRHRLRHLSGYSMTGLTRQLLEKNHGTLQKWQSPCSVG